MKAQSPTQLYIKAVLDKALGRTNWSLDIKETKSNYSEKLCVGAYTLSIPAMFSLGGAVPDVSGTGKRRVVASWTLAPMINCCGIVVSTRAEVAPAYRGKGLGSVLNRIRIAIARELGYSVLLCTDDMANNAQRKILEKNGWTDIYKFHNCRTAHMVAISVVNLNQADNYYD